MQTSQFIELNSQRLSDNQPVEGEQTQPASTSWSQRGKAAVVFTLTTGAYTLLKAMGCAGEYTDRQAADPLIQAPAPSMNNTVWFIGQGEGHLQTQASPLAEPSIPRSWDLALQLNHKQNLNVNPSISLSPLIALGTVAFTLPHYPLSTLSLLSLSFIQSLPSAQAVFPATLDLANLTDSEGFVLQGATADDQTGHSVSSAGDVNGDGLADVLVGAWVGGVAYILFGSNSSWPVVIDLASMNASLGVVLQDAVSIRTGRSVNSAGDVNGDGLADVLVGAPYADPLGRSDAGVAYLIFGRSGSWPAVINLASMNASQGVVFQGAATGDYTGNSINTAGDVNGDGLADVLVGAYQRFSSGAGVAYLLFGMTSTWPAVVDLRSLTPSRGVVLQGAAATDDTGFSVSSAGDVNGDGLADMLVGAWMASPLGRSDAGVAYLLFGRNGSWPAVIDLARMNASLGVVLQGAVAGDRVGYSVNGAGDVNGDNLSDVLLGVRYADPLSRTDAGMAYLLFGKNGSWPAVLDLGSLTSSQGVLLQGAAAGDIAGISVNSAGDVNGDGLADMLVGASGANPLNRTNAGAAYLLFGRSDIWPAVIDLANLNASLGVVLQGAAAGDGTGRSVSSAGDVNGDGLADMLMGARDADPLGRNIAGVVYMIVGQGSPLPSPTRFQPRSTNSSSTSLTVTQRSESTIRAFTQNSPSFSLYSNAVLYLEIGIEVIITTDNLSVEGFTGDPNQFIFTLPDNDAYTVTVNGEEQNSFPLWAIQQGFVGLTLADEFCFEDFNEIPIQATDGRSTTNFNFIFQGDTASCIFSDASTLNTRNPLQRAAMLLVSSGLGLLTAKRRDKTHDKKTELNLLTNDNNKNDDNNVKMKLSA